MELLDSSLYDEIEIIPISKEEFSRFACMYSDRDIDRIWKYQRIKKCKMIGTIDGKLGYIIFSKMEIEKQSVYDMAWEAGIKRCHRFLWSSRIMDLIRDVFCSLQRV